jgi:hypothetical protein
VQITESGLVQIVLPPETLNAAQAGLDDLRILDDHGRELPYVISRPVTTPPVSRQPKSFRVVLGNTQTGLIIESGINEPLAAITLQSASGAFLKSAVIEGSVDGRIWETTGVGEPLYRQPGASRSTLPLPQRPWPFLRVTIDDRRSAPVIFTGATLHAASGQHALEAPLAATLAERNELPGETRLTLNLAGAHVRLAEIQVLASDPLFVRPVRIGVREISEGQVRERIIARDSISRIALENPDANATAAKFPGISVPTREIILTIENGDSPPLHITAVQAKQNPVLAVFHVVEPGTVHLLTGNDKIAAPRYDLAALGDKILPRRITSFRALPPELNPHFAPTEVLPDWQPVGAAIDLSLWRFRKALHLTVPGVQETELDLEALSGTAAGLADFRVIAEGKQLPYVLERPGVQRQLPLVAKAASDPRRPTVTRWEFQLPHPRLPLTRIQCTSLNTLLQRRVTILEEIRDERGTASTVVLGEAHWMRTPERPSGALAIPLQRSPQSDRVWLEIENGDNAPLALAGFVAWHSTARVLFKASTPAPIHLYYGNPKATAPRYDLQLAARHLLTAVKTRPSLGPQETLRKLSWSESDIDGDAPVIFWLVLGGVVVLLIVVLAKLLPKSPANPNAG